MKDGQTDRRRDGRKEWDA